MKHYSYNKGKTMKKNICIYCSILILLLGFTFLGAQSSQKRDFLSTENSESIEGVYEFVSQEINTTKPTKEKVILSQPEWKGMWQINKGYFSSILMKNERNHFFDCEEQDLGYESFAGGYILKDNKIVFTQEYSLHPFYKGRPITVEYKKVGGDTLVLIQVLHPTVEDMREGSIKTTLKRLK